MIRLSQWGACSARRCWCRARCVHRAGTVRDRTSGSARIGLPQPWGCDPAAWRSGPRTSCVGRRRAVRCEPDGRQVFARGSRHGSPPRSDRAPRCVTMLRSRSARLWSSPCHRTRAADGSNRRRASRRHRHPGERQTACRRHIHRTAGCRDSSRAAQRRADVPGLARSCRSPAADRDAPRAIIARDSPEVALLGAPASWVEHRHHGLVGKHPESLSGILCEGVLSLTLQRSDRRRRRRIVFLRHSTHAGPSSSSG